MHQFTRQLEQDVVGMQGGGVAILQGGHTVYEYVFGHRKDDLDPITPETLFLVGSVSKPMVATAIAKLVKEGKLDLDRPISDCIIGLDDRITTKHLLSHTTGYEFTGTNEIEKGVSRKKLLSILLNKSVVYEPGTHYQYNNLTFSLLDHVIGCATNQDWKESIYSLSIEYPIVLCTPTPEHIVALPHDTAELIAKSMPPAPYYPKNVCASAGTFASLEALKSILRIQMGHAPEILTQKDLLPFYTPQQKVPELFRRLRWLPSDYHSFYALGWRVLKKTNSQNTVLFHTGYLTGINAFIGFMPEYDLGIIIMLNEDSAFALGRGIQFFMQMLKDPCCNAPLPRR